MPPTAAPPPHSRRLVLAVMCVGYFLVLLDVTIVNVALPSIGAGLGAGTSGLQWTVDGYAIALASLMLGGGAFGDLHGHKRVVLAGLALFGLASLGCGGALVQAVGWRAVFVVNVPIVVVAFVVALRVVGESAEPRGRRLDRRGIALGALTLAATTFALIELGDAGVGAPVVVAAAVAVPGNRAGLASAVNNTARQAGGAIGIAAFGALAGAPAARGAFVGGLHVAALATAGLFVAGRSPPHARAPPRVEPSCRPCLPGPCTRARWGG